MSLPERYPADDEPREVLAVGGLRIYPDEFQAYFDGEPLRLTQKEFLLLSLLASKPGRVLHRDHIADAVWGGEASGRTIDIHISRLRRLLPPEAITTVIRVGYRLTL